MKVAGLYLFVLEAIRSVASTQIENGQIDFKVNCPLREAAAWEGDTFVAIADNMSGSGGFRRLSCEGGIL